MLRLNTFTMDDLEPGGAVYEHLMQSMSFRRLVPVLGSGFSRGLCASGGAVPGVNELKVALISILCNNGFVTPEDCGELSQLSLSDVYEHFSSNVYTEDETAVGTSIMRARNDFKTLFANSFSGVSDVDACRAEFLSCGWQYLYTLNYDDAIESVVGEDYRVVTPFMSIDKAWLRENRKCVIKLHGDVEALLTSSNPQNSIILDKRRYFDAITAGSNMQLIEWLKDDFASNDLLFVGCSLEDEYDLLFASTPGLKALSPVSAQRSYYVYYDNNPKGGLPLGLKSRLAGYGIQNVLRVQPSQMEQFYSIVSEICHRADLLRADRLLESVSNYTFAHLSSGQENKDYLFSNKNLFSVSNDGRTHVTFPSFMVERDEVRAVLDFISRGVPMIAIIGRRFCGKSYALLQILEALHDNRKETYYFGGTTISDEAIGELANLENAVLIFDAGTIYGRQVNTLSNGSLLAMRQKNLQIVLAVNRSDRSLIDYVANHTEIEEGLCKKLEMRSVLSKRELGDFNARVGVLGLQDRKPSETFLDYALRIDSSELTRGNTFLPDINILTSGRRNLLVCVLAIALHPAIDTNAAAQIGIIDELSELCKKQDKAVQVHYLSGAEQGRGSHASTKYVTNSVYWLCRCISNFVRTPAHDEYMVDAMRTIAERIHNWMSPVTAHQHRAFYRRMRPYMFFDNLVDLFFLDEDNRWVTLLPKVYDGLAEYLIDSFQYFHQYAKCELRCSRRMPDETAKLELLNDANHKLDRAFDLASEEPPTNDTAQWAMAHIMVTKALVLTNYLKNYDLEKEELARRLADTIDAYHYALVEHAEYVDERLAIRGGKSHDSKDFYWFASQFSTSNGRFRRAVTTTQMQERVEAILSSDKIGEDYVKTKIKILWDE